MESLNCTYFTLANQLVQAVPLFGAWKHQSSFVLLVLSVWPLVSAVQEEVSVVLTPLDTEAKTFSKYYHYESYSSAHQPFLSGKIFNRILHNIIRTLTV